MPLLIWEKKLQESVKRTLRFGWSVRNKRGKVLVQRFYPDINKKFSVVLPIAWEPNEDLNVLNSLQEINEVMNRLVDHNIFVFNYYLLLIIDLIILN